MLLSLLRERRSIRKFLDKPVEPEKIDQLIEAALRGPSGRAITPWEFVVVSDKGMLEKLAAAKAHGSAFVKNAALAIVVCADPVKQDVWIEDASIASITIHYAAASLGLGSCWVQIRERMQKNGEPSELYVRDVLNIPAQLKVLSIIAIGYSDESKAGHPKEKLPYDKVHHETYGS